jgi:hypothetical protein
MLTLRYGRGAVLAALARAGDQTVEDLEGQLATLEARKDKQKAKTISTASLISSGFQDRPELIPAVESAITRYENRAFLPHLRDVQRFFDRYSVNRTKLKSRKAALPSVIRALATMHSTDIHRLLHSPSPEGDSDYAILAREIMGGSSGKNRPPTKSVEKSETGSGT